MANEMKVGLEGIELVEQYEGCVFTAYQDIAGVWTIGFGHTETAKPGMRITRDEARALLFRDLRTAADAVGSLVTAPLNNFQFDALVSLVFNIGGDAFRGSTVRKRINGGDSEQSIAVAWGWWCKATVAGRRKIIAGLKRRRAAEIALYRRPIPRLSVVLADDGTVSAPGLAGYDAFKRMRLLHG